MTALDLLMRGRAAVALLKGAEYAGVNLGTGLPVEMVRELARLAGAPIRVNIYSGKEWYRERPDRAHALEVFEEGRLKEVLLSATSEARPLSPEEAASLEHP